MGGARGSETRQLTKGVFVRFTDAQLVDLNDDAQILGISVPELLRSRALGIEPAVHRVAS